MKLEEWFENRFAAPPRLMAEGLTLQKTLSVLGDVQELPLLQHPVMSSTWRQL